MSTSKSPKAVLTVAFQIRAMVLPLYAHKFSPKKFTQPQLFACLVFKEFMLLDWEKGSGVEIRVLSYIDSRPFVRPVTV